MSICVVHLVREINGIAPFREFIHSYNQYKSGQKHDLLIVFKGFKKNHIPNEYKELLHDIKYNSIFIMDWGYDIRAYTMVTKKFNYRYFCFLNSFSVILSHDWLYKMYTHISDTSIGLVGSTASYQSLYSSLLKINETEAPKSFKKKIINYTRLKIYKLYFKPFPNYHIRTNAFIISRDLMLKIKHPVILRKLDALYFESGKNSLTRQVLNMGFRVIILDKNGQCHEMENWKNSNTYFHGNQENLLISDNKTRVYSKSDSKEKHLLSKITWENPN